MSATAKKKDGYDIPWVEKYRPNVLDDVVGNEETLLRLRSIASDDGGSMPNLILSGPPGTGKVRFKCCPSEAEVPYFFFRLFLGCSLFDCSFLADDKRPRPRSSVVRPLV